MRKCCFAVFPNSYKIQKTFTLQIPVLKAVCLENVFIRTLFMLTKKSLSFRFKGFGHSSFRSQFFLTFELHTRDHRFFRNILHTRFLHTKRRISVPFELSVVCAYLRRRQILIRSSTFFLELLL